MRFFCALCFAALSCQIANGQPSSQELITKFRKTIGADVNLGSVPFLIQYRGVRYMYSLRDGRLTGDSFDFDAKLYGYADKHNMHRKEMEMKIGVVPFKIVEVINKDNGWYQFNEGEVVAMSKAEVDGRRHREHHVEVFLGREAFDPKLWKFSEPKGAQVRGEDAWVFEAKSTGMEPTTMYFSKQSGLLVRLTSKTTDFAWLPGEKPKVETFVRDLYLRDWKKYGPRMVPGNLESFHDGVMFWQMQPVNVSLLASSDPKLFEAPQPRK